MTKVRTINLEISRGSPELIDTSHVVASLRTPEDLDTFQEMHEGGSQVREQHKSRPSQYLYA